MSDFDWHVSRPATARVCEMVDQGDLGAEYVMNICLGFMSDSDVAAMLRANDITMTDDEEEDEDLDNDEGDGPDPE